MDHECEGRPGYSDEQDSWQAGRWERRERRIRQCGCRSVPPIAARANGASGPRRRARKALCTGKGNRWSMRP